MKLGKGAAVLIFACLPAAGCNKPYKPSAWLTKVSPAARAEADPLSRTAANVLSGRDTYGLYCSACHGEDGAGRRGRPSLRTPRVQGETDGDLHWILENGSRNHGMPAWRSLGEGDLWQLVQYIRSLPSTSQRLIPAASPRSTPR